MTHMRSTGRIALLAAAAILAAGAAAPALAQAVNLGAGGSGDPIEILARNGIEWNRDAKQYIARGDARASQAGTTVEADVLTAYYREGTSSRTEIYRYQADGNVRIFTQTHRAVGDRAIFDIDTGVLVLTGKDLKLTTPGDIVTARDALEYWDRRQIAVARGDALVVTQDGRRMKGDLLTAHFMQNNTRGESPAAQPRPPVRGAPMPTSAQPGGSQRLQRVEAFGDVHISTETDIAVGDRGVYNAETGIAVLAGNVKITRGQNQLNGDFAEVNTNTGVSRLLCQPGQASDNCVRGLFVPDNQKKDGALPLPQGRRTQ
jgi:lipopolysaccharide export system protein LptA